MTSALALTLRDLRRLADRRRPAAPGRDVTWLQVGRHGANVPTWPVPEIDQLIARHGASALVDAIAAARPALTRAAGESPASADKADGAHCSDPNETTSVSQFPPPSQESDDDHDPSQASKPSTGAVAKDGNEPRPAERSADGPSESWAGAIEEPSASEVTSQPSDGVEGASARDAAKPPDDEDASPCGESGARSSSDTEGPPGHRCTEGRPVTEVRGDERGESTDVEAQPADADHALCRPTALSRLQPSWGFGGDYADHITAMWQAPRALRGHARDVVRALLRLLRAIDIGGEEPSPRLDARRLVVELASRRYALGRAIRRELAPALVVLAADCSGSCSAVCDDTLRACVAVARELPYAIVVRHSNGEVLDAIGQPAAALPRIERARLAEIPELLHRPVACTVAFGDWDAGDEYQALCEAGERLYWLDSYAARSGSRPASRNLRAGAAPWRRQPAGWWQGVNDAQTAAFALRDMRKS